MAVDPSRLQYELAVETMTIRRANGLKKELPKAAVASHRPTRRQYALSLCDWDLTDAEFDDQIRLCALSSSRYGIRVVLTV